MARQFGGLDPDPNRQQAVKAVGQRVVAVLRLGHEVRSLTCGLRESRLLAILVASVGPTALSIDRPSIDARQDQCSVVDGNTRRDEAPRPM